MGVSADLALRGSWHHKALAAPLGDDFVNLLPRPAQHTLMVPELRHLPAHGLKPEPERDFASVRAFDAEFRGDLGYGHVAHLTPFDGWDVGRCRFVGVYRTVARGSGLGVSLTMARCTPLGV
jgi:hypothetical protein